MTAYQIIHFRRELFSMRFNFYGKNMDVTDGLRSAAEKKIGRLGKFFGDDVICAITFSIQKEDHKIEVAIPTGNGVTIRAEEVSDDMYESINLVIDSLERQIRKNKTKLERRYHDNTSIRFDAFDDDDEYDEAEEFRIVRSKKFAPKPMSAEEAILQMNLIGHNFFVYLDADTEKVNVVYKRKDGDYGLIEPEF